MVMGKMQDRGGLPVGARWRIALVCVALVCFQAAAVYCIWMNASEIALAIFAVQAMLFGPALVCYWKTKDFNPAFVFECPVNGWAIGFAYLFLPLPELKKLPRREKFECIAALAKDAEHGHTVKLFNEGWWSNVEETMFCVLMAVYLHTSSIPSMGLIILIMAGGILHFVLGIMGYAMMKSLIENRQAGK